MKRLKNIVQFLYNVKLQNHQNIKDKSIKGTIAFRHNLTKFDRKYQNLISVGNKANRKLEIFIKHFKNKMPQGYPLEKSGFVKVFSR